MLISGIIRATMWVRVITLHTKSPIIPFKWSPGKLYEDDRSEGLGIP